MNLAACGGGSSSENTAAVEYGSQDTHYLLSATHRSTGASSNSATYYDVLLVDPRDASALTLSRVISAATLTQGLPGSDGVTLQLAPQTLLYVEQDATAESGHGGALRQITLNLASQAPQPRTLRSDGVCRVSPSRTTQRDTAQPYVTIALPGLDGWCGTLDDPSQLVRIHADGSLETISEGNRKAYLGITDPVAESAPSWLTLGYADTTSSSASVEWLDSRQGGLAPIDFSLLPDAPYQLLSQSTDRLILQGRTQLWQLDLQSNPSSLTRLGDLDAPQRSGEHWNVLGQRGGSVYLLQQLSTLPDLRWALYAVPTAAASTTGSATAGSQLLAQGAGVGQAQLGSAALLLQQIDATPLNRISLLGLDGQPGATLQQVGTGSLYSRWLGDDVLLVESRDATAPFFVLHDAAGRLLRRVENARQLGLRLPSAQLRPDLPRDEPQLLYLSGLDPAQPGYGNELWLLDRRSGTSRRLGRLPTPASLGSGTLSVSASGSADASGVLSILLDGSTVATLVFETGLADSLRAVQPR